MCAFGLRIFQDFVCQIRRVELFALTHSLGQPAARLLLPKRFGMAPLPEQAAIR